MYMYIRHWFKKYHLGFSSIYSFEAPLNSSHGAICPCHSNGAKRSFVSYLKFTLIRLHYTEIWAVSVFVAPQHSPFYFTGKDRFWNLLSGPLYREWSGEWEQSVFPNMTPCLPATASSQTIVFLLLFRFVFVSLIVFGFVSLIVFGFVSLIVFVFPNMTPCLPPPPLKQ